MVAKHVINVDLAKVYEKGSNGKGKLIRILPWGAPVEVIKATTKQLHVRITDFEEEEDQSIKPVPSVEGYISIPKGLDVPVVIEKKDSKILRVDFVDVQQGDGAVIQSPAGKIILIDGGDNQLFARYLANRFRGTSEKNPKKIDCILVSHGDADHFLGLTKIHESETDERLPRYKRLFIQADRVYHNGLVKRPSSKSNKKKRKDIELLGGTKKVKDPVTGKSATIITELETNLLKVPDSEMNQPFLKWKEALKTYNKRGAIQFRHLLKGDDDAFDFVRDEGVDIQVFAPILTEIGSVKGLKFLGRPKGGPRVGQESLSLGMDEFSGLSASHTINGHSVIFRLRYKNFCFLFSGDLNDEAGRTLASQHNRGEINLQSEVFKVPHHGSADFSGAFMQAVSPVISVVSSGDESSRKEYIHPRATLVGALGKYGRVEEPLVFVTELAAFFEIEGFVDPKYHELKAGTSKQTVRDLNLVDPEKRERFFALSRKAFGIVMIRTDGERLLVYTNSALTKMKEAYAYCFNEYGKPEPTPVRQA